jgi:threonine/homoserine/homoserine lactone efflux protein
MNMENLMVLAVATAVLVLIPGPNVALIVANTLGRGMRAGMVTVMGTTAGIAVQLLLVVGGMATLIGVAASALAWIKWLGVVYLLYLGIRTWREPASNLGAIGSCSGNAIFGRGLIFAVINPKTLLFNAAFLPQFISAAGSVYQQLLLVAGVYLCVIVCGDLLWACCAFSARRVLMRYSRLRNRLSGGFLVGASLGLALARRST